MTPKTKEPKPEKQTDKKKSTELPDNQNEDTEEYDEFTNELLELAENNDTNIKEVIKISSTYFRNTITRREFIDLIRCLKTPSPINCVPVILRSKMKSLQRHATNIESNMVQELVLLQKRASRYPNLIKTKRYDLYDEGKLIDPFAFDRNLCSWYTYTYCVCHQTEVLSFETAKLQYKLGCDYHRLFLTESLLLKIEVAMRKAYRRTYLSSSRDSHYRI